MRVKLTLNEKINYAYINIKNKGESRATNYNNKHLLRKYHVGDEVLLKRCNMSSVIAEIIEKFLPIYEGPYTINNNNTTYVLKDLKSGKIRGIFHGSEK